jgi:hypothetical protein
LVVAATAATAAVTTAVVLLSAGIPDLTAEGGAGGAVATAHLAGGIPALTVRVGSSVLGFQDLWVGSPVSSPCRRSPCLSGIPAHANREVYVLVLLQGRAGSPAQCRYFLRWPAHCLLDRSGRLRPARQAPARQSAGIPAASHRSSRASTLQPASKRHPPLAHSGPAHRQLDCSRRNRPARRARAHPSPRGAAHPAYAQRPRTSRCAEPPWQPHQWRRRTRNLGAPSCVADVRGDGVHVRCR